MRTQFPLGREHRLPQNSYHENARIKHDKALLRVITFVMKDNTGLFKQYMDNPGFKR